MLSQMIWFLAQMFEVPDADLLTELMNAKASFGSSEGGRLRLRLGTVRAVGIDKGANIVLCGLSLAPACLEMQPRPVQAKLQSSICEAQRH